MVYEAAKGLLETAGIEVMEVSDSEAAEMKGHKKTPVAGQPNRANEKLTSGSVLLSAIGDSSSNANVPSEAVAKITNNTKSTKNNIRKSLSKRFNQRNSDISFLRDGERIVYG